MQRPDAIEESSGTDLSTGATAARANIPRSSSPTRLSATAATATTTAPPQSQRRSREWLAVPGPLRRLFDAFPLLIYPPNEAPLRSRPRKDLPSLYVFSTEHDAGLGRPSFNPGCLKWQTYLRFNKVRLHIVPSNNHASPTGALPFLLVPPSTSSSVQASTSGPQQTSRVVGSNKIQTWARDQGYTACSEPSDQRYDAVFSLLDNRIRKAWLLTLYINPHHKHVMREQYIEPSTSNSVVRKILTHQLRRAAQAELLKSGEATAFDVHGIFADADDALGALSMLLRGDEWFFGTASPSLFDASVFAYLHPILERGNRGWCDRRLITAVIRRSNLVRHRQRILDTYYS